MGRDAQTAREIATVSEFLICAAGSRHAGRSSGAAGVSADEEVKTCNDWCRKEAVSPGIGRGIWPMEAWTR